MPKKLALTQFECYKMENVHQFEYHIIKDDSSCHKERFHVWIHDTEGPVMIGCELPLDHCQKLVKAFDSFVSKQIKSLDSSVLWDRIGKKFLASLFFEKEAQKFYKKNYNKDLTPKKK